MKTFAFVIFSVLLLFVGLAACGGDRDIERQLDRADADGAVIATAVAELSAGLTVMLPGGVTPGMTLRATIG